jgi:release factor glutamine methyltransferase
LINQLVTSIRQALQQAAESLKPLPHGSPELEAAVLLCHLLEKPRSFLYAWPDKMLTKRESDSFHNLIGRRLRGEPIAHITGIREFWSLALKVSPATLIPRPETELLVEQALAHLRKPSPWPWPASVPIAVYRQRIAPRRRCESPGRMRKTWA